MYISKKHRFLYVVISLLSLQFNELQATDRFVTSNSQLTSAISAAQPGDNIILKNGTWSNAAITFSSNGTAAALITMRAETPGGVTFSGASTLTITGKYLVVAGFRWTNGNIDANIVTIQGSYNRVTQCAMINYNAGKKWIVLDGFKLRVDHNRFEGKNTADPTMQIEVKDKTADYHLVDHNHFAQRPSLGANGGETIRAGYSGQMDNISRTIFEYNLFEECDGENEIISNKSCENLYRFNTIRKSQGQFCFRHGDRNVVYSNFFLGEGKSGTGGVRVIGSKNYIINNYFSGLDAENSTGDAVIILQKGQSYASGEVRFNPQIDSCVIAYNTIVGNISGKALDLNNGGRPLSPLNVVVANNLISSTLSNVANSLTGTEDWRGNIFSGPLGVTNPGGIAVRNPGLTANSWKLLSNSLSIDSGKGGWGGIRGIAGLDVDMSVAYDIDGQPRTSKKDVGCDEAVSGTATNRPLTTADVGPEYLGGPASDIATADSAPAAAVAGPNTPVGINGQLKVIGLKLCNQYNKPIQLRGMSTHGLQWYGWQQFLNDGNLDTLASWGADVIRISMYVQDGGYQDFPDKFTTMVNTLIDEASERGMYAVVDFHQLKPGDPNYNLARAKKFFTDIATRNKNKNNILYDICNEPNGVSWATIKSYADQIIPLIRAIDNDAPILIGTHAWSSMGISDGRSAQDIVSNPLNYTNIMYNFHFYAKDHRDQYLNELSWAADRLPVFVTEFGTQEASGENANDFVMAQKYIDMMRQKKISWVNWNYSNDWRSGAVWKESVGANGPWTVANLKEAGVWIRSKIMSPADDFPTGDTSTPACVPVSASSHDGNVPANAIDNDLNTRWSATGNNEWIQFCLGTAASVSGVDIAFFKGNERRSLFDVLAGNDGINWTTVASGLQSSGTSLNLESFTFTPITAKYIRIVGHGNNVNAWNSYAEVVVKTGGGTSTQVVLPARADAYVRNGASYADIAHGVTDSAKLVLKKNPTTTAGNDRLVYLSFDLNSVAGTVSNATLKIYGRLSDNRSTNIPVGVYPVANTSWTENSITWNNKPAAGTAALKSATVTDSIARYYTWDISGYVQAEKAAGRNIISLLVQADGASTPVMNFESAESGSNAPQLVVTATAPSLLARQAAVPVADQPAEKLTVLQVYPNPSPEHFTISFSLKSAGFTTLAVYDMTGKVAATLVEGNLPAGSHTRSLSGATLPTGTYLVKLVHSGKVTVKKIQKM
ncbi:chondroitinase-B domain-containing protein [Chitinophaga solisilvae]|uniref:chondroitinase-B domain-containing protein n=1 Tax=Chitinophaga solisilvae TaxID=1233460 RepID=UPI00136B757C|nr:chondroitinase-B domain-containing protein [Chitinophaga solisilvae]